MEYKNKVLSIVAKLSALSDSDINLEDKFSDIGIDSLKIVQLIIGIEDELNIKFDDSELNPVTLGSVKSILELTFTTFDYPALSEEHSKVFTISPNDKSFEYIVDMSDNERWNGIAKQLRFDPVSYDNISMEGDCIMEYIEISDSPPIYGSEKDYLKTQGVNGWSYHTYNNATTYREMVYNELKEMWSILHDDEITISPNTQTSKNHIGTARKWTCPTEGNYTVKYNFNQIAENSKPGKERLSHFILRRNHKIIEKDIYDRQTGTLAGSGEIDMTLETGEVLSFEFYNGSEHTTETLQVHISIEKTA